MEANGPSSGEHDHDAGPIGRVLRMGLGTLVLASINRFYIDGSIEFVLLSVMVVVGLVVLYIGIGRLIGRGVGPWLGGMLALLPLILVFALGVGGGPIFGAGEGQVGVLTFLGVSLVLAGIRGDSGCEVMAVPNALAGNRGQLACLVFSPIDRWERNRRQRGRHS